LYRFGLPEPAHYFKSALFFDISVFTVEAPPVVCSCGVQLHLTSPQDIYDASALDLKKLGKSFGFSEPPHVPLDLTGTKRKKVKMDKAQKRSAALQPAIAFLS
jgi:hypothetical protein